MKKALLLAGIATGVGIYFLTKEDKKEQIINKIKEGKEALEKGLENVIASLEKTNGFEQMSEEELMLFMNQYVEMDEKEKTIELENGETITFKKDEKE